MATADTTYDRINDYASVKISLARPHDIRVWSWAKSKSLKRSTIELTVRKRMVCSANEFSGLRRTGNVPAVNTAA